MRSGARGRSDNVPALVVVAAGAGMLLAALTFAASSLYIPGTGFLLLGLGASAWVGVAARSAGVSRRLGTRRLLEGETFEAVIEVSRGRLGLPNGTVHDVLAGGPIPVAEPLSVLWGSASLELRVVTRIARRGRHELAPPSLTLTDPLGLARADRPGRGAPDVLLVLPRHEPVRWAGLRRPAGAGRLSPTNREPTGAGELDGLRDYMPGTPAARIHWPALARGAGLLERRFAGEPEGQPLIVLDPRMGEPGAALDKLDAAVRAAASLTLELARAGGCSVLLPGARAPTAVGRDLGGWPAVHARLALVVAEPDDSRAPAAAAQAARGPVFWVAAGVGAARELELRSRASTLVLVVPSVLAHLVGGRPSLRVSGCTGVALRAHESGSGRRRAA